MPDREKVSKGLERCLVCDMSLIASEEGQKAYIDCEYTTGLYCRRDKLLYEVLALLKEQEAVEPVRDKQTGRLWLCGNCGSYVGFEDNDPYDPNEFDKYCRECGRPILWEGR